MKIFYDLNLSIKHGEIFIVKYGCANIFYLTRTKIHIDTRKMKLYFILFQIYKTVNIRKLNVSLYKKITYSKFCIKKLY